MEAESSFKIQLEDQIESLLKNYVGQGGNYCPDGWPYVVKWSRRLADFNPEEDVPMVIIIAKQTTQFTGPGQHEMGTSQELWTWQVNIYYFDVELHDFMSGYLRCDNIVNRMRQALENEPRLQDFSCVVNPTSPLGAINEYVYNNDWNTISWDSSGADEDYLAFVGDMSLTVQTARSQTGY